MKPFYLPSRRKLSRRDYSSPTCSIFSPVTRPLHVQPWPALPAALHPTPTPCRASPGDCWEGLIGEATLRGVSFPKLSTTGEGTLQRWCNDRSLLRRDTPFLRPWLYFVKRTSKGHVSSVGVLMLSGQLFPRGHSAFLLMSQTPWSLRALSIFLLSAAPSLVPSGCPLPLPRLLSIPYLPCCPQRPQWCQRSVPLQPHQSPAWFLWGGAVTLSKSCPNADDQHGTSDSDCLAC